MRRALIWGAVLGLLMAACGGDGTHADVTRARDPQAVAAGAAMWEAQCALCHGANLEGGETPDGGPAPALDSALLGSPDSAISDVISDGKRTRMPAFGSILSRDEIQQIVDHIRTVQAANLS